MHNPFIEPRAHAHTHARTFARRLDGPAMPRAAGDMYALVKRRRRSLRTHTQPCVQLCARMLSVYRACLIGYACTLCEVCCAFGKCSLTYYTNVNGYNHTDNGGIVDSTRRTRSTTHITLTLYPMSLITALICKWVCVCTTSV